MIAKQTYPLLHQKYMEPRMCGRYINYEIISPLIEQHSGMFLKQEVGTSEGGIPIDMLTIGSGEFKILAWSQMHGNESTTTKAFFDFLNFLADSDNKDAQGILKNCTIYFIPMLNPDGSNAYTRVNGNQVDLNRDAKNLSQKESISFRKTVERIQPDFAFNLHGQRTIFSAGDTNVPASISFLSPAADKERSLTPSRKVAMQLIVEMNKVLQEFIPNGVGRYDDGFNDNCTGDTLAIMNVPTILFEAGHYPKDYKREYTRKLIFYALLIGITTISNQSYKTIDEQRYFSIPENGKNFNDILIRQVYLKEKLVDIAIQYEEQLYGKQLQFIPKIVKIGNLENLFGHREIHGNQRVIRHENDTVQVVEGVKMLNFFLNDELFSTEPTKI
ncbi:peptidase M14 [Aquimarina sp. ERC-38]|uniref:M14 family zinc carboxypeptidase n=1 Tax=Aquimarina sp. ERC-38 TaxID=2949996 RepID=UPI002247FFE1|nr:M14 family zinc carboxypeptidase [Aquimarina sp. ERC-38]UZO79972.1 peptidase M14 [Aquimarina sp. ERC-38]